MYNRKLKLFLFIFLGIFSLTAGYADDWKEKKSEHFIVYFEQDDAFAQSALDGAEKNYRNIANDLGYARYSEFWTWDKRVKIYIYPDHDAFLRATGQPSWSEGMADYTNKQIISYVWGKGFIESLLPHEIAHLVFRDFVGFKGEIPLWLDEGVAQWEEEAKRKEIKNLIQRYFQQDNLLLVSDIMKLNISNLKDKTGVLIRATKTKDGKDGVLFLSSNNLIEIYYMESVSLIGYLIEKFGSAAFSGFCRELRDGKSVEDALKISYPLYIHNIQEFEDGWREYLKAGN
ncbi:MAG TPA: hypothetical protein PL125_04690 [Candidatus Omnitrophota bacterium]|nr:hypothetical protein [Candidatus Omnitrophota bacterium]